MHEVILGRGLEKTRDSLDKPVRQMYQTVVAELRREGCGAGGYKLMSVHRDDLPLCCRHLKFDWRILTQYPEPGVVAISGLYRHSDSKAYERLSELAPIVSSVGRKRRNKPPCCDDPADPPAMIEELERLLW